MKNLQFIYILSLLILSNACFPDMEDKNSSYGVIEYNGQEANIISGTYENINGKTQIDLVGENFVLSINLKGFDKGTNYDLSEKENKLSLFNGNKFIEINKGNIKAEDISGNKISGSFTFNYENSAGADICHGYFNSLEQKTSSLQTESFSKEKFMFIDAKKGEIRVESTKCNIKFDNKSFALKIDAFPKYSLNVALNKVKKNPAAIILYPKKEEIKLITIDKMKNNQLTILMKNGNSLVVL